MNTRTRSPRAIVSRWWPILLLLIALGGGYWFYQQPRTANTAPVATNTGGVYTELVAVQQGDLDASISVVGELQAVQQADLAFDRMSGVAVLASLQGATGSTVKTGQTLAAIDPEPYQQALDQARSALEEAVAVRDDLKMPATALATAQAELAVAEAKLKLQTAQAALAELESPDLTAVQQTLSHAQNNLQLAQWQQTLAEHDSLAKSERDLLYAVDWHQRRIRELNALAAQGAANAEQIAKLDDEQEALAAAQAELARVQAQRQLSLQAAAAAVTDAQVVVADAQETLAAAQTGGDDLALAQAKLAVREAEVALAAAEEGQADLAAGADPVKLAAAEADVAKKQLVVSDAEAALAGATLVAPFDGTILQTNAEVGDRLNASSVVLTIANLDALQVAAAVDETIIRQVSAGQAAKITFDAFPGQTFTGEVLSVPLQGTLQGNVMVYEVPISLTGAEDLPLLVGMTANIAIQVGQVTNALLVPTLALQSAGGLYQVRVATSTEAIAAAETVPVEVGLSNGVYTEIVRGLNVGDQVVVEYSASSSQGFRMMGGDGFGMPIGTFIGR